MKVAALLVLWLTAACALPQASDDNAKYKLPDDFLLGGGTSAIQTEGGWDADGKGPNVFDYDYHKTNRTPNADVASDFYHRYAEDIDTAAEIGFNVFRFSIAWSRIFPNGESTTINEKGVKHYHDVIDKMLEKKITPMVTMFHFDYPQALEDKFGGWLSSQMVDAFADYADFLFKEYGGKVRHWLTVNEASFYCLSLGGSMLSPTTFTTTDTQNTCLKNTILAHAKAYDIYVNNYKKTQNGMIGFGTGPTFVKPANLSSPEDAAAAKKSNEVDGIALSIDPLVFGDFPELAKTSRKLSFTDAEKKQIKGRIDYLGVNMYGGRTANASKGDDGPGGGGGPPGGGGGPPGGGGGPPGGGGGGNRPDGFGEAGSWWVLREMPLWVKDRYGAEKDLPVFITENGVQAEGNKSALDDWDSRAVYCSNFLRELAAGINENGTRVFGYSLWSFIDTFEFNGFSNWGLVHVDFDGGTLDRTKKDSWTFFKKVMQDRVVPLVEAGSQPFPSGSAAFQSSIVLAITAILFARWFQ